MASVFMIEEPRIGISVSTALEFGQLQYLFDSDFRRSSVFKVETFAYEVLDRLRQLKFNHAVDFFVMTGSLIPVSIAIVAMTAAYPSIRLLFYNAAKDEYTYRKIEPPVWREYNETQSLADKAEAQSAGTNVQKAV